MDENDVLGMLGIIAATACLILFILAGSMDSARSMGDVLILSGFAGVLAMIFFGMCDRFVLFYKNKKRVFRRIIRKGKRK